MSDIIYSNKIPMNAIIKIIARGEAESNYFIKATGGGVGVWRVQNSNKFILKDLIETHKM